MGDSNVKQALKRDLEQTKSDLPGTQGRDIDQDVDNTIRQAAGKEEAPQSNHKSNR